MNAISQVSAMGFPLIDAPLTSVAQPTYVIGRTAVLLLFKQIENKGIFVPQTVILNGRLNIRESSIKLSAG